ncbi:hypothetical protein PTTG_03230 [Puccinia triticina 1-1 BBBD Race 1]|uniref:Uncharacterized protein n=1 Tax=Puccinia triticina (isolate 1-1 / race 1 (BBBD)) TaxID=630390 RepID=A0A180GUA6_PUCT1|nr:hypothetical protein PTTG_03230 [Puccinia triticina 1-1 BBBD Race 1]
MNLATCKASVASLRLTSSLLVPEEWVNEIEEESSMAQEDGDSDLEAGDEGGKSLPHHSSSGSTRRSTPSLAALSIQSVAHNLSGHNKDKLKQTGKQLSLIHSLIICINKAHRQTIRGPSCALRIPSTPCPIILWPGLFQD